MTDALQIIFKSRLQKRTFLENFDLIVLTFDEVIDDGVIMEIDANTIAQRVLTLEGGRKTGKYASEDTLSQVLQSAKDQVNEITSSLFSF